MTNIEVEINDNYICVYERLNDDCIRLLHMYGKNPVCVVPDMLDGGKKKKSGKSFPARRSSRTINRSRQLSERCLLFHMI